MKTALIVLTVLFCTAFVYGQNNGPVIGVNKGEINNQEDGASETGLVKGLDVSFAAGTVFYKDQLGYNGILEARAYMMELPYNMSLFTGVGGLYQYTKSDLHTMNHTYGFGLLGLDYFFLKETTPSLALRTQLAIGGGYTWDKNSIGDTAGKAGYILYPSIGATYSFGKFSTSLMFGYEIIGVSSTTMRSSTVNFGVGYSIF